MCSRRLHAARRPAHVVVLAFVVLALVASALPVAARPYGAEGSPDEVRYGVPASEVQKRCVTMKDSAGRKMKMCFHWTTSGPHRSRPGWVDATEAAFKTAWNTQVKAMEYRRPLADGGAAAEHGPNRGIDIYLADIGEDGSFGYCTSDRGVTGQRRPAYCVVDNDFAELTEGNKKVELNGTAAHEFFHAVQYAYDVSTPKWLSEGTAVWMEDQVFDGLNTNHRYLDITAVRQPEDPLDLAKGSAGYGAWLFWQYIAERFDTAASPGHTKIRAVWDAARDGSDTTPKIMKATSKATGKSFGELLSGFGAWNYAVGSDWSYEEGEAYFEALGFTRPPLEGEHILAGVGSTTDVTGSSGPRTVSAAPRSTNFVRIEAGAAMAVQVKVTWPSGFDGREFAVFKERPASFARPQFYGGKTTARTITLQAGEAVILVLANPTASTQSLKYRAEALQP